MDNELRLDWFHSEKSGSIGDDLKLEVEKSVGLFTFEVAPTYESTRSAFRDPRTGRTVRETEQGLGSVELGGRFPFLQFVSPDRQFDTTFVFGMEVAVPTRTKVSRDVELVPRIANLTRLGAHWSLQLSVGDSILVSAEDHGLSTLEYDLTLGYELTHDALPVPGVVSVVPLLEFSGERVLNHDERGRDALFATLGARINFEAVRGLPAQPRLGVGFVLPVDGGAREDMDWGVVTSLVFEY